MVEVIHCENFVKSVTSLPTGRAQEERIFELLETSNIQSICLYNDIYLLAPKVEAVGWPLIRTYKYITPDKMMMIAQLPDPVIITIVDTEGFIRSMTNLEKEDILKYTTIN